MHTTCMNVWHKHIYKHTSNLWESNHRDVPVGHNNCIPQNSEIIMHVLYILLSHFSGVLSCTYSIPQIKQVVFERFTDLLDAKLAISSVAHVLTEVRVITCYYSNRF